MSEYIVRMPSDLPYEIKAELNAWYVNSEPIVRCRDCKHYYEAEEYHPQSNYDRRCCKYFDTYDDEVEPNGFCAWGEKRDKTSKLLSCPFCRGEAEPFNPFDNTDGTWCVLCTECGASTGFEQTEAEAIAVWNTRAERKEQQ